MERLNTLVLNTVGRWIRFTLGADLYIYTNIYFFVVWMYILLILWIVIIVLVFLRCFSSVVKLLMCFSDSHLTVFFTNVKKIKSLIFFAVTSRLRLVVTGRERLSDRWEGFWP